MTDVNSTADGANQRPGHTLLIDFETKSDVDLIRRGVYPYVRSKHSDVLCMAWAFDEEIPAIWRPGMPFPPRVVEHVRVGGEVQAWNMAFDRAIWNLVLCRKHGPIPFLVTDQSYCLMAAGLAMGLPGGLEKAAKALKLNAQKDDKGRRAMLKLCKPAGADQFGAPVFRKDPELVELVERYALQDVRLTQGVRRFIRRLPADEIKIWRWDQLVNNRGFQVDLQLAARGMVLVEAEKRRLDGEICTVTNGDVTSCNQVAALTLWCNVTLESLGKKLRILSLNKRTIKALLAQDIPYRVRSALLLRQEAAKASTAKLKAAINMNVKGRIRGALQYHGAGTGRWAGRGIQPHNLPRITLDLDTLGDLLDENMPVDLLEFMYPPLLTTVSQSLRQMIVAAPGHILIGADMSQIEARINAYLAGQWNIVKAFAAGQDVYVLSAESVGSTDRQLGKVQTLALGFGMGAGKFKETAEIYKVILTDDEAEYFKTRWREENRAIVEFWYACNDAAIEATENPKHAYQVHRPDGSKIGVAYMHNGAHLWCRLPSGRMLCYPFAKVEEDDRPNWAGSWGVTYWTWSPMRGGWVKIRGYGGLFVENVVQAVARDVMVAGAMRAEHNGFPIVLHVHDSAASEIKLTPQLDLVQATSTFCGHMTEALSWAPGLPLAADGYHGPRFSK